MNLLLDGWSPGAGPEIIVDTFAGAGGASCGIERALGRSPDVALNHDPVALAIHQANHPHTRHICQDIWQAPPVWATQGRPVGLLWASPDCTHYSRAKGKAVKRDQKIRELAWGVVRWAEQVHPRVIILENVAEFRGWGPLDSEGKPIHEAKGDHFRAWLRALRRCGYRVEHRVLKASDYGAPTSRERFFLIARRDGRPIVWPEPTHGPGRALPYRTAAECIDWSIPCPSIFLSKAKGRALGVKRPLEEASRKRIAKGIVRYVLQAEEPFLAPVVHSGGCRPGRVAAFMAKYYSGVTGCDLRRPLGTVTARDHHALVVAHVTKYYKTGVGSGCAEPLPTITSKGLKLGVVAAFLTKYYKTGVPASMSEPLDTITAKARFGLVTVQISGDDYVLTDIGLRMLSPRELALAQGFRPEYRLNVEYQGRPLSKEKQVRGIGNSVPPDLAEALAWANVPELAVREVCA